MSVNHKEPNSVDESAASFSMSDRQEFEALVENLID
jgi:hypothetical protein